MPFQPGQSGNPRGRPRDDAPLKVLARQHTETAILTLVAIMQDVGAQAGARVTAAVALLDRGYGKPKQEIEATGNLSISVITGVDRAPDDPDDR